MGTERKGVWEVESSKRISIIFIWYVTRVSSFQMNYKGRVINYSAKGRVHSWSDPWVYDATARDVQSGISAEARHYDTSQEAIQHAVQKLKDKLQDQGVVTE